jgi:hypothetical protein
VRRIVAKALPPELGSYFNRMGSDMHLGLSVDVAEEVSKESRGTLSPSLPSSVLTGVLFYVLCYLSFYTVSQSVV